MSWVRIALAAAALTFAAASARAMPPPPPRIAEQQLALLARLLQLTPPDAPERPDLLLRRATVCLDQARALGPEPLAAEAAQRRRAWLDAGIADLRAAAAGPRFSAYGRADELLFYLSWALLESDREEAAHDPLTRLFQEHPSSRFLPDALVAFAERRFARHELDGAEQLYQQAAALGPSRVRDFARYKAAWCRFERGDYREAMAGFAALARDGEPRLREAARGDLVHAFARGGAPADARAYFAAVDAARADELLDALAAEYRALGHGDDCRALARGAPCD